MAHPIETNCFEVVQITSSGTMAMAVNAGIQMDQADRGKRPPLVLLVLVALMASEAEYIFQLGTSSLMVEGFNLQGRPTRLPFLFSDTVLHYGRVRFIFSQLFWVVISQ
ncbi:hypothetical protein L4D08_11615 [Photobacterium chitinilyticum]|uniref:hypothetical protein n=1 Tax=Photobacterium chitinilyticum TaxID=2485123 RepID=UPI003D0BB099